VEIREFLQNPQTFTKPRSTQSSSTDQLVFQPLFLQMDLIARHSM
jgi:hypothetical protein